MRRWLQHSRLYVPLLLLICAGWASSYAFRWNCRLNGSRSGIIVVGDPVSLIVGIRGGWQSRDWIEREHLRAIGGLDGDRLSSGYTYFGLGFGVLAGDRFWNGHRQIVVWHRAIALPWWYLLLLVAGATPLERFAKWLWIKRRSERRRRAGLCPSCGYNLTGNVSSVCPECGMSMRAPACDRE